MPNWYTINYPTSLHKHNETSDPLLLADVKCILQAMLTYLNNQPSLGFPRVTILLANSVLMLVYCLEKHSRPPDLKSSPNVSATHLLGLQGPQQTQAQILYKRQVAMGSTGNFLQQYFFNPIIKMGVMILNSTAIWQSNNAFVSPTAIANIALFRNGASPIIKIGVANTFGLCLVRNYKMLKS